MTYDPFVEARAQIDAIKAAMDDPEEAHLLEDILVKSIARDMVRINDRHVRQQLFDFIEEVENLPFSRWYA